MQRRRARTLDERAGVRQRRRLRADHARPGDATRSRWSAGAPRGLPRRARRDRRSRSRRASCSLLGGAPLRARCAAARRARVPRRRRPGRGAARSSARRSRCSARSRSRGSGSCWPPRALALRRRARSRRSLGARRVRRRALVRRVTPLRSKPMRLAEALQDGDRRGPTRLIRFSTVNPPGDERECQEWLAGYLRDAGLEVELDGAEPERPNLVARARRGARRAGAGLPLPRGHRARRHGGLDARPVGRRGARRLPVRPRRDRHEEPDGRRGRRGRDAGPRRRRASRAS